MLSAALSLKSHDMLIMLLERSGEARERDLKLEPKFTRKTESRAVSSDASAEGQYETTSTSPSLFYDNNDETTYMTTYMTSAI